MAGTMTDQERLSIKKECKKFIRKDTKLNEKLKKCSVKEQEWVLNYLSAGKGVIPYEMITRFDSLDIAPENDFFFLPHHFYSSLKDTIISKEDYDLVKKLYRTLKLENLGELNKLYNFQDIIILCEVFGQRSAHLQEMFKFNPKNVILLVLLVDPFTMTKVNVCLPLQLTLNKSNFLKRPW